MLQFFQKLENPDSKFHIFDAYYRLRKIQKVCQKEDVDGLLIVNGIDSKDNYEYIKLMNWLFLGFSGIEIETNEYLDSALAETLILITKNQTRVYADQAGFKALKPYLLHLPNIQIFTPTPKEDDNKEECEYLKIAQFVRLMQGIAKVGVLLEPQENKKLEKWPLIQSYALLENGFFSMQYQVINMTDRISQLYRPHDKHSLKSLTYVTSQRLRGHVQGSLASLTELPIRKRLSITSDQLAEIFQDSMEIEANNKYAQRIKKNGPMIQLGPHVKPLSIEHARVSPEIPCLQLVMESVDLLTSLRFARTYFLTKQVPFEHQITPVMSDENFIMGYAYEQKAILYHIDECFLADLYKAMVISLSEALLMICKDYRKMVDAMVAELAKTNLAPVFDQYHQNYVSENLLVTIKSFNAIGEEIPINFKDAISFKLTPQFFLLRIELANIISPTSKALLGSIMLGDSFILQENCYFVLTKHIPYLQVVNTDNRFTNDIEILKKRLILEDLGQQLSEKVDKNRIFVIPKHHLLELPIYEASYYLHRKGLRVYVPELGWFVVFFRQMKKIQFTHSLDHTWLLTTTDPIILAGQKLSRVAFEFAGKSVESVYLKMLEIFNEDGVQYLYIENPKEFTSTRQGNLILKKEVRPALVGNEIVDPKFLLDYIESKQLIISNQVKGDLKLMNFLSIYGKHEQVEEDGRNGLILVTGSYSSGKNKFALSLQKYARDFNLLAQLVSFSLLEISILDEEGWVNKLLTNLPKQKALQICVVPAHLQVDVLINLLQQGKAAQTTYIRCIVNKINVNNFYQNENNEMIQGILSLCLPGYNQFVMVDSFGNNEDQVEDVFKTVRSLCQGSNLFRITNNIIQPSVAKDIYADNSFNTLGNQFLRQKLEALRARSQTYSTVFIANTLPCLKTVRKQLRDCLTKKPSVKQEKQKVDEMEKLQLFVKETLATQSKILYVKAIVRVEGQLDRLYEITANQNYVIDRLCKNVTITMEEMVVNGEKMSIPRYRGWDGNENLGFLFYGENLDRKLCRELVDTFIQRMRPLEPFLSAEGLSAEVIKQIEFANRTRGLVDGQFYDGQFIRDQDGEIMKHHPRLKEFVGEYLERENKLIDERNRKVKEEWENYVKVLKE